MRVALVDYDSGNLHSAEKAFQLMARDAGAEQTLASYGIADAARRPLRHIGFDGLGHQVRDCLHPADLAPLVLAQLDAGDAATLETGLAGQLPDPQRKLRRVGGGGEGNESHGRKYRIAPCQTLPTSSISRRRATSTRRQVPCWATASA